MAELSATLIDVGSGDSILIELTDGGQRFRALVDCNDEPNWRVAEDFLKKRFRTQGVSFGSGSRAFEFVLLTHAHADHMNGLKRIMSTFGTDTFYYPDCGTNVGLATLVSYCDASTRVGSRVEVDSSSTISPLGNVAAIEILWPPRPSHVNGLPDTANQNTNSVVIAITLQDVSFVLTGDCEAENWNSSEMKSMPSSVRFFKVPHHGGKNGVYDNRSGTPWVDRLAGIGSVHFGLSTHVSPYKHPHRKVMDVLERRFGASNVRRTDTQYHLTFSTSGSDLRVRYSHR
jgi:beta-lactamase superfamily II metal-dependent hydrolase